MELNLIIVRTWEHSIPSISRLKKGRLELNQQWDGECSPFFFFPTCSWLQKMLFRRLKSNRQKERGLLLYRIYTLITINKTNWSLFKKFKTSVKKLDSTIILFFKKKACEMNDCYFFKIIEWLNRPCLE